MRQFLLGKSVDYPTALTSLAVGQIAFVALVSGVETLDSDGTKIILVNLMPKVVNLLFLFTRITSLIAKWFMPPLLNTLVILLLLML